MLKITESSSLHNELENKSTGNILLGINQEDQKVATAVQQIIPSIEPLIDLIVNQMRKGGRLFYIGAGTSGRLGILDASECPPTFGVSHDWVIGLIAGGDSAIRKSVEFAEDDTQLAWQDLSKHNIDITDVVIGIAASGTTPYVVHGLKDCQAHGIVTGCITCNPNAPIATFSDYPIEVIVGPEYVTGSTRMKSGTAQKMVLNMISTATMIKLGRIMGNRMVDMQLSNDKLKKRGIDMLSDLGSIPSGQAESLLEKHGSVREALKAWNQMKQE